VRGLGRRGGAPPGRPLSGTATVASRLQLHLHALDGTPASLDAALRAMRHLQPKQVMVETCHQRFTLAQRAAKAAVSPPPPAGGDGSAEAPRAFSQADVISVVHGGLRGSDVVALVGVADEVGTQVYMVDRPYQETQNRVARQLVTRPSELLAFVRYMTAALSTPGTRGKALGDMGEHCPGVREIVATQRELYMANEVVRRAVTGVDILLVCTDERASGLQSLFGSAALPDLQVLGKQRATRAWPFLLILCYLLLPGYAALYLVWRSASGMAAALGALVAPPGLAEADLQAEGGGSQDKVA